MTPRETLVRDEIAARPELIEPGLVTVQTNFHLTNAEGTRGFIDVLARDRRGLLVVIEVKRSDSAAREAIHEVLKYCELLRRERGIRSDGVRAVIASTTWRELLVPFSQLTRTTEYPIEGVKLLPGDHFPRSLTSEPVTPLPLPSETDLATVALRADVENQRGAELVWQKAVPILNGLGVDDMLGIAVGNEHRTVLHIAIGTVVSSDPRVPVLPPDQMPPDEGPEYAVAIDALQRLDGFELVSPDRLRRIRESNGLELLAVFRTGRFSDQSDLLNDGDALAMAEGSLTWSQIETFSVGRPSLGLAWQRMRNRLAYTLDGNPEWTHLVELWLDEVQERHPDADVMLRVYNPCDLMAALVHSGLGNDLPELLPQVEGGLDLAGAEGRILHGCLVWNGEGAETAANTVRTIYRSPADWATQRAAGLVWETDLALLHALGLRYALVEFHPDDNGGPYLLSADSGALARAEPTGDLEWPGIHPFPDWLRTAELEELLIEYWSSMTPVNGGDQWLTFEGPQS